MSELSTLPEDAARSQFARLRSGFQAVLRQALDAVLSPLYPSCRSPLGDGVGLCAEAFLRAPWHSLHLRSRPRPVVDGGDRQPAGLRPARAAVCYDDIARALVLSFKYGDRLDLAPMMGRWMARAGRELLAGADALIPVPLHWRRLWSRRFNQSAALAGAISQYCGVPVLHEALKRVRATPQQVGLSKSERADNVQGAFRVPVDRKAQVVGRRLVLIDDVLTSGATVDTCARALLRARAAHVDLLVFARVVAPVRSPI
jgi:ComF family protein